MDVSSLPSPNTCTVAVIGLGYVGLPLAVSFATPQPCQRTGQQLRRRVLGFEINANRLDELRRGCDTTNETSFSELQEATLLEFTTNPADLADADVFVITVPTPIDTAKRPDLSAIQQASVTVGQAIKSRADKGEQSLPVVILESTVYPGAMEEVCVPLLERESGLTFNLDFVCGYSPERINPGDREHRLTTITKVTSGSTLEAAAWVDGFYGSIVAAGTYCASSIKVAEAAKVIENTQRDLNIALVNELALIFQRIGIDTLDVLAAAGTKWNFLPFRPGLVGGHCIGVDPYYLTYKAEQLGYLPQVVLAGRRINDGMGEWAAQRLVLAMAQCGEVIAGARVLVLGLSFKENCPDLRNTRVVDVIQELRRYGITPVLVDPWVDQDEARSHLGETVNAEVPTAERFAAVLVAVAHREFLSLSEQQWRDLLQEGGPLLDLKGVVPRALDPIRL